MNLEPNSPLSTSDAQILVELERILKRSLPQIKFTEQNIRGYAVDKNRVIRLNLEGLGLSQLPACLTGLSQLRVLDLSAQYVKNCGSKVEVLVNKNHFHHIDLSPLLGMPNLKRLDLSHNSLKKIDLTPLSVCGYLESLKLSHNNLEVIDLDPLMTCTEVQKLVLSNNKLQSINLTPIQQCTHLEFLDLSHNSISDIDLIPLRKLVYLNILGLENNLIQSLDVTPLLGLFNLEIASFDRDVRLYSHPLDIEYYSKFLIKHFSWIDWLNPCTSEQERQLFDQYLTLIRNFWIWESWPDYKRRRMQDLSASDFFDYLVEKYFDIKDKSISNLSFDDRSKWRTQIEATLNGKFLNAIELFYALKEYWEPRNENSLCVDLVAGNPLEEIPPRIYVLSYWTQHGTRVNSVTWLEIIVHEETKQYELKFGFNGGLIIYGENLYPPPSIFPPRDNPLHSTEVSFEIERLEVRTALEIVQQGNLVLDALYKNRPFYGPVRVGSKPL